MPTVRLLLIFFLLLGFLRAQAGEGLFDSIISDANKGSQKKEFAKTAIREAFTKYAKSVFVAEAGKPVNGQNTDDGRGNIRVTVPITLRVNQSAYTALCLEIKKRIEDPRGLSLNPVQIAMKLSVSGDKKSLYSHIANAVGPKTTGHVFCILTKVDPTNKQAELDAYSIDSAVCEGLSKNVLLYPDNIRVDILDENQNIIGTDIINITTTDRVDYYFRGVSLYQTWNNHLVRKNEREGDSILVLVAPDCFSRGVNRYQSDMNTPIDYPIVRRLTANFNLSIEILRKAKALRCVVNYKE